MKFLMAPHDVFDGHGTRPQAGIEHLRTELNPLEIPQALKRSDASIEAWHSHVAASAEQLSAALVPTCAALQPTWRSGTVVCVKLVLIYA